MKKLFLSLLIICLAMANANAQCSSCTYTYNGSGGTSFTLNGSKTLCITGNASGLTLTISGTGNKICVASGVTWSTSGQTITGCTIEVYGTFSPGSMTWNTGAVVNVNSGATANFSNTTIGASGYLTINNSGTVNFTSTSNVNFHAKLNNNTSGTLNATNPSRFIINNSTCTLTNNGTATIKNFENNAANFVNGSSASLLIKNNFYNHGLFTNNGTILADCSSGGANGYSCEFVCGNKGTSNELTNNGCITTCGYLVIDAPNTNNGVIIVNSGANVDVWAPLTGNSGRLIVKGGQSNINCGGAYTGTNLKFCDQNTFGNAWDYVYQGSSMSYTVDCSQTTCTPATVNVYGTVYNDANGLNDGTVNGTGIGTVSSTQLYAYWVNASNVIAKKDTVNSNGTYAFTGMSQNVNYTVVISTTNSNVGATAPSTAALPSGWVAVGDAYGMSNGAGSGNQSGTPDVRIAVNLGTVDVSGVNFGLDRLPSTVSKSRSICACGNVQSPALSGSDPEDGSYGQGSNNRFLIRSIPSNGTLYYNGTQITSGMVSGNGYLIANYDSTKLTVTPNTGGVGTVSFTYAACDAASQINTASVSTISITFSCLSISGTMYDDGNGLNDGTVNGTGIGLVGGIQLYAYLVNAGSIVVDKKTLPSNGTFTFDNVATGTNFTVRISTQSVSIGTAAPSVSSLPINWIEVGEAYGVNNAAGTGNESGTPNLQIAVNTSSSNITNVNLSAEQYPGTNNKTYTCLPNPGGAISYQSPSLSGSDAEDGTYGHGSSNRFLIKTIPSNANLYYNGTQITSGMVSGNGYLLTSYDSTKLTVDPTFSGAGTVTFTYTTIDAASKIDATPATVTITFGCNVSISGTVYDDYNGTYDGVVNGVGINQPSNVQLYAYLVNGSNVVLDKVTLPSNGTYTFSNVAASTAFTVVISTSSVSIGGTVPSSASLPSEWEEVGEDYGTNNGAGNGIESGTPNLKLAVTTGSSNVTDVDFGIDKYPGTLYKTASCLTNPGGSIQVVTPSLQGSDFEEGNLGQGDQFKIRSVPSNATLYYNGIQITSAMASGSGYYIGSYDSSLLKIDPTFTGNGTVTFTYSAKDAAHLVDQTPDTIKMTFGCAVSVSGIMYNDHDGLQDGAVDGTPIGSTSGSQLYAYLISSGNVVLDKVTLPANGTFTFSNVATSTSYTVRVSTQNIAIGGSAPGSASLPTNWEEVGEAFGTNNGAGSGNEGGTPNMSIAVTVGTSSVTNIKFGAEQYPVTIYKQKLCLTNPGGSIQVVTPSLQGTDFEEGNMGQGKQFKIFSIPSNANLYYNGTLLTSAMVSGGYYIGSYDSTLLKIDPTFTGAGTVTFAYSSKDAAHLVDQTPDTIKMTFNCVSNVTISGTVYNDHDGLQDGVVDGTGIGSPSSTQLYAYLVNGSNVVLDKVTLPSNGTYTFSNVAQSTAFTVVISTSSVSIGATAPSSASLPTNWEEVGEAYGTNNAAGSGNESGTPNLKIAVTTGTSNVANVNFGIEQYPVTIYKQSLCLTNPGSTTKVVTPSLQGSDFEEGNMGQGDQFKIMSVPSNATLYYNGTQITSAMVSGGGYYIGSYDSTLLKIDPTFTGAGTVTFAYSSKDAAHLVDQTPDTIKMSFNCVTYVTISGTLFNDANGLNNGAVDGTGEGLPSDTQMYAYLVNGSNVVVDKVTLPSNGTYTFSNVAQSTAFTVVISSSSVSIGATAPSSANLPTDWVAVGDAYGINNAAGSGNQSGTADVKIAVTTGTSNVTGVNFGIEMIPDAKCNTRGYCQAAGTIQSPALYGTDYEDGTYTQGSSSFFVKTIPSNANVYYNGTLLTTAMVSGNGYQISNYDSTKLTVTPSFSGNGTIVFDYTVRDAASQFDGTGSQVTINFTCNTNTCDTGTSQLGNGSIQYWGVRYNYPRTGWSTVYYTVKSGKKPAISHVVFGLNTCTQPTQMGKWTTFDSTTWNYYSLASLAKDPTTGSYGLKFDYGFNDNESRNYFIVVNGNFIISKDSISMKAGQNLHYSQVCEPSCSTYNPVVSISGTLFNDANGLNDGTVNGTGVGSPSSTQMYTYLVNGSNVIVDKVTLPSNGTYTFSNASQSTAYTVVISSTNSTVGSTAPSSANLPTNWVAVGDAFGTNNGAGSGNQGGTPDVRIAVTTGTSNVTGVNFGIERLPSTFTKVINYCANPTSGTVQVPALYGTDPEDGTYTHGSNNNFLIRTLPANANVYYNGTLITAAMVSGNGYLIANYDSTKLTIDPTFSGPGSVTFTYAACDAAGQINTGTTSPVTVNFTCVSISGTLFNDANGLGDATVNGTGIGSPSSTQMYAYLVNGSNVVVDKVTLPSNGTYTFNNVTASAAYTVRISSSNVSIGGTAPSTTNLPTNWVEVGEAFGTNNAAGSGNEGGTPNCQINVTTASSNITGVNFGIEQRPYTNNANRYCLVNPGSTTKVQTPALSGTDPEDGNYGQGSTFIIKTLPTAGTLYYNNVAASVNQVITGYDSTKLTVDPTFTGTGTISFTYTTRDAAEKQDETPATVTMTFNCLINLSGNVFNDTNALLDATVNGAGINKPSTVQLYINLLNASNVVVATITVPASGAYNFIGVTPGNYTVQVTTIQGTVGNAAPSTLLPSTWLNTGENIGTTPGNDGTVNGLLPVVLSTFDVTNANLGIQQHPFGFNTVAPSRVNPGGTQCVAIESSFISPIDSSTGRVDSIHFTVFPTNATSITIGFITYTSTSWPINGVTIKATASGQPAQSICVDPINGEVTVRIFYKPKDNGGAESPTTWTHDQPFHLINISGTVYNDADGTVNGVVDGFGIGKPSNVQLFAYLTDGSNLVLQKEAVLPATGDYFFDSCYGLVTYTVIITTQNVNVGATAPSSSTLPTNWVAVGEDFGTDNVAGSGIESGTPNLRIIAQTDTVDITEVDFGIERISAANSKLYFNQNPNNYNTLSGNGTFPFVMNLFNNSGTQNGNVNSSSPSTLPGRVSGTDPEDGLYAGSTGSNGVRTIVFTALPNFSNTVLVYFNGTSNILLIPNPTVTDPAFTYWNSTDNRYEIPGFDAGALKVFLKNNGHTSFQFNYAWRDAANVLGTPNLYYVEASGPLPINLFSFDGKAYAGQVLVDWVSAQEEDMSHYVLEKNIDGQYQEVATVQAVGESKSKTSYDAVDTKPLQVNIYRLRAVSNDGTEQLYYTTVTMPMAKTTVEVKQVNDANTILINGMEQAGTIKLYAMNGSLVNTMNLNAANSQQVTMDGLAAGMYVVQIISIEGKELATTKVVKQ